VSLRQVPHRWEKFRRQRESRGVVVDGSDVRESCVVYCHEKTVADAADAGAGVHVENKSHEAEVAADMMAVGEVVEAVADAACY